MSNTQDQSSYWLEEKGQAMYMTPWSEEVDEGDRNMKAKHEQRKETNLCLKRLGKYAITLQT